MKTASTKDIAQKIGLSEQYTRRLLIDIQQRGLVERIGKRGGWIATDAGKRFVSSAPSQETAAAPGDAATGGGPGDGPERTYHRPTCSNG
ncbi:MAG: hypothetical protein ABIP48_07515 [Planctomycetota bacterium]